MPEAQRSSTIRRVVSRWTEPVAAVAGLALIGLILLFVARGWTPRVLERPASERLGTVAVLPVDDGTRGRVPDDFAGQLTMRLSDELAAKLPIVSASRSREMAGSRRKLTEVARALGADTLIVGTMAARAGLLRVRVRIVDGETGRELWTTRVDRGLGTSTPDASDIARELSARILGDRPTP